MRPKTDNRRTIQICRVRFLFLLKRPGLSSVLAAKELRVKSIGTFNTTSLRLPARATSASAAVATTGSAVLPCRAIRREPPGGGRRPGAQTISNYRHCCGKFFVQKKRY